MSTSLSRTKDLENELENMNRRDNRKMESFQVASRLQKDKFSQMQKEIRMLKEILKQNGIDQKETVVVDQETIKGGQS